jgi:putative membrane protein
MGRLWIVLGLLIALPALADENGKLAGADDKFAHTAWMVSVAEVQLGELALKQTTHDDVKKFAQAMIDDHGKARDELDSILKDANETHEAKLDAKHQSLHDKLAKLSGDAFDKAYVGAMVKGHTEALATFKKEEKSAKDSKLKAYAEKFAPVIAMHLEHAKATQKALNKK